MFLGGGSAEEIQDDVIIPLIVVDGKAGMLSLGWLISHPRGNITAWMAFITDAADLMNFGGVVTFVALTELPDTQCVRFAPMDDNTLEGTHDLELMINSTAFLPLVNVGDPDSLSVIITDDEAECKMIICRNISNTT